MNILKLAPAFKDYLWGGNTLSDKYGMQSGMPITAEAWTLSCHKDGHSTVCGGEFDGKTLAEVIDICGKEILGSNCQEFEFFPLLIKFIDARQSLSIQVHPSDEYALKNEGQYGKTEIWYVVDSAPDAFIYYGFSKEISREEFRQRIENNTITEVLGKVPAKKGDCFFIESGTLHAIGAGLLIAEIQQNSNCTYRIYDFGRLGADGKPRELHIDKAAAVTVTAPPVYPIIHNSDEQKQHLADCKYFNVDKISVKGEYVTKAGSESFVCLLFIEGECEVDGIKAVAGDCLFIPAGYGDIKLNGECTVLESRV